MSNDQARQWKWYVGFAPSIGWEMAFQGAQDLLTQLESASAPERLRIRRPSKLDVMKGPQGEPLMKATPWVPKHFGAVNAESEAVVGRNLFLWVQEATEAASADWDETWLKESNLLVIEGPQAEAATEALAREAKARQELTRHLKNPHLRSVK